LGRDNDDGDELDQSAAVEAAADGLEQIIVLFPSAPDEGRARRDPDRNGFVQAPYASQQGYCEQQRWEYLGANDECRLRIFD
jgi:hypothetical protein